MKNIFETYVQSISDKFSNEKTSEMGYRADFESLLKGIFGEVKNARIMHDPRTIEGNKPDFIVLNHDIPILYIEAKDIGVSLDKVEKSEQMSRYFGYANLVLTDYVEFRFYRNGLRYEQPIKIADYNLKNRTIEPIPGNYEFAAKTLLDIAQSYKEPIKSGEHLSKIMGGKAQRIRDNVRQYLDSQSDKNAGLVRVYETIKRLLVHDLTLEAFADMYAQTLVYGLFVARYHDDKEGDFTRQKARELVPASNPLLRHFFDHIVGPDFDKRLEYIVNELCEIFSHANVKELMSQYFKNDLWGKTHEGPDPVIHFYEDFLKEYDPELRKKMGAFYTPLPVVRFIIRAVDYVLEKEFGLNQGLANATKVNNLHKVQILDPAVGTGTFLTETIRKIYSKFETQKGRWPEYVYRELLPRLYGFELMMAPYTIAHLKMSMVLKETGFKYFNKSRLGIYLTNSLEGVTAQKDLFTGFGFAESIAEESKEASKIKNERPIMVVIGNPPYSVSSSNKGEWILNLIADYKKGLGERKINLDDDYIKFIRFAEHFIEKNGSGVVAMITNNSFIDGVTHRQMRKHLLETFDEIYIFDLHGNSKKKEKCPDGGKDENVFNIMQGVGISVFVRRPGEKKGLGKVYHSEIYGKREHKFEVLDDSNIKNVKWNNLNYSEPYYFFVPKDFSKNTAYDKGFKITDLFLKYSVGIKTKVDNISIDFDKNSLVARVQDIIENKYPLQQMIAKFNLAKNTTWEYEKVLNIKDFNEQKITPYDYRPFDTRFIYYDNNFLSRSRSEVMDNFFQKENIGLETSRNGDYIFISKNISDEHFASDNSFKFPLYVYDESGIKETPNLNGEIFRKFIDIDSKAEATDVFDYVYAVLHSPKYREKYKEFLKIDFPRVPYPQDKKEFNRLAKLGAELRELHLMESSKLNKFITTYPEGGNNEVEKVEYKDGNVYINANQHFGKVPEIAWNFYIGGYQPAQKWLKDRKGRRLTNDEIEHYQKIIVAMVETDKIMKEIDE